jgi:hypothetical protein
VVQNRLKGLLDLIVIPQYSATKGDVNIACSIFAIGAVLTGQY